MNVSFHFLVIFHLSLADAVCLPSTIYLPRTSSQLSKSQNCTKTEIKALLRHHEPCSGGRPRVSLARVKYLQNRCCFKRCPYIWLLFLSATTIVRLGGRRKRNNPRGLWMQSYHMPLLLLRLRLRLEGRPSAELSAEIVGSRFPPTDRAAKMTQGIQIAPPL